MFKKNCLLGFVEVLFSLTVCLLIQLDDFYILFLGAYLFICTLICHDTGVEIYEQLWGVGSLPLLRQVSFLPSCCTVHSQLAVLSSPSLQKRAKITNVPLHIFLGSNSSLHIPLSSTISCTVRIEDSSSDPNTHAW